jgi:hypothetical protein
VQRSRGCNAAAEAFNKGGIEKMRNVVILGVSFALLAFSPFALAQGNRLGGLEVVPAVPGPGWKTCPRCQNPARVADDRKKAAVDTHAFDPHDLSGVWGNNGIPPDLKTRPPLTASGQKLLADLMKEVGQPTENSPAANDPLVHCDPLGNIRSFGYNYGMEFVQTPGRVFQFIEWGHTWRTIYTDGRKLPDNPPVERFMGYAVGRWDGDTFVVESNGYDTRALIGGDATRPLFPHSSAMKVEETYKRLNYGKLQATLTIIDPEVYTKPWTTSGTIDLLPNVEIWEYLCVPSESEEYNNRVTKPALGK